MNKIYKVIWSKAKHTYVVASEIAKGHTKGETTGKGLKKLAAALLVAAALMGPNFAWAEEAVTIKVEPAPDTAATVVEVYTKDGASNAFATIENVSNIGHTVNTLSSELSTLSLQVNTLQSSTAKVDADGKVAKAAAADSAESATKAAQDGDGNVIISTYATKTEVSQKADASAVTDEASVREAGDKTLNDRITAVKEYVLKETGDNYVSKADAAVQDAGVVKADKKIGENVTALGKGLYDETAARIGADAAQDKVIQQVNDNLVQSVTTINKNVADGFTALNQADANEAAAREAKDNELNERITNEANGIHDEIKAGDEKLDTRITNVKEYLEKQTSDKYVSKADAAVQDGAIVKAANTIGENVTNLDAALAKETAARLGADKAQDKVIEQVNQNMVDGFNTINKNMSDGFTALNQADANELAGRMAADTKLVEAVNSGLSLSDDNVLQKNTTAIDDQGKVTTSKTAAKEMILNKDKDNQITLNENGIKVGTNSTVVDKDGVYTGGDTFDAAKAAMSSDGQIKGANGKFTVDASGNTTVTSLDAGTGTIQTKGDLYAKDATFSGDITAKDATLSGDLSAKDGTFSGDVSAKDVTATGTLQGAEVTDGTATLKQGKLTGVKDIETEALHVNGDANVTGKLTTKDLEVTGEFNANTLKSRLDENNYTEIHGGNVTSKNLKVDKGVTRTSESSFDENGREEYVTDNDSRATVKVGANEISQTLDDKGDNPEKAASRVLSQNTNNKYEITDSVVEGNQSNVENRTADTTDSQISFKDDSGKVLNKSYITQNLKKVLMGVEEGDNRTTIEQDANNITNTAKNGTITNDAGKLVNTASESVTTQIGDGSEVQSVMNGGGIANKATGKSITNDAATITNTGTTSVTNQVGNNKVLVDTTHVQSAFGDTIYTTWDESGITNNAADKTVATNAKNIQNTATGDISNIASNGTISNEAKTISNKADEALTNDAKTIANTASESVTTQIGDGSEVQSVMNGGGIANKATGKSITNDAATITNTGTTSVTNQVGNNKVLVDTTHVQSAFGDTIYTTWDESGITNNAADKTVATNAKNIQNTATGDISNIASNGTISNEAKTISNKADEALTNDAKTIANTASESVTTQIGDGSEVQSVMNGGGIANKATGKSITNDAATITNTGTTSVTNQVGNNKVLVDTTHVQSAFGDTIYTTWDESGITNNAADKTVATNAKNIQNTATGDITNTASTGTITNDAKTLLNKASESITDKVGENVERTMTTNKISESVKDGTKKDGTKSNSFSKTAEKDINIITDGTKTSTLSQLADSVNTSLKNGTQSLNNTKTVTEDVTKVTDENTGAFSSSSQKADSITSVVKDTEKGTVSERSQTVSQVQDKVGTTTVTTTDGLTKLSNEAGTHNTQMDFAEVLKDLGVRGNAVVDGTSTLKGDVTMESNASVGKNLTVKGDTTMEGNASVGKDLTVAGKSTLTGDVTMESNATVEKDLTVNGTTTTDKLVVNNGATIKGGATVTGRTTTDTLKVTGSSEFDGAATFNDIVTMSKGLSVTGGVTADTVTAGTVTADSYKVGDKTYIDKDGINANNQVIRNVGQGNISEGSTDAVSGGQLYETNTRVSGLETRMGTVETRVDKLDNKIDKVGANAAAMANLHPLEFDEDSKWNVAAAVGSSGSETASAVGVFYRPNENVMVNASAAMGTGENMFGGGVSLRLGHGGNKAKEAQMKAAAAENKELRAKVDDLTARMDALLSVLNPNMSKDFPDVPENHWAYEAVSRLAGNGIVEGYEDGKYHGERQMTRYEMAEIIYNALSKGAKAEKKLVEEFRPELQAMAAQKKA